MRSNRPFNQWLTVLLDAVLVNAAFALAYWLRYQAQLFLPVNPEFDAPFKQYAPLAAMLTLVAIAAYAMNGLYLRRRGRRWLDETGIIVNGTMVAIVLVMGVTFVATAFVSRLVYSRLMFIETAGLVLVFLSGARLVRRWIRASLRRRGVGVSRALIVGAGEVGRGVMSAMVGNPGLGYVVAGFVDDRPEIGQSQIGRIKGLGNLDAVGGILAQQPVDEVIVTLPWTEPARLMMVLNQAEQAGVIVRIVPDVFQLSLSRVNTDNLGGIPVLSVREPSLRRGTLVTKRIFDLIFTPLLLLVGSPLFGLIALAIILDSRGPVFFRQERVGKSGEQFHMYKFRSMVKDAETQRTALEELNEADGPMFKIRNDPRVTRVGRFLRQTSLDELPQLFNVLRGEMSLVGPRPGTPQEVAVYQAWHRRRLEVYPGMSGLWQVRGRSDVPFDEMCLLDIYYIENWSLWLDLRILAQTVPHVLFGKGAY